MVELKNEAIVETIESIIEKWRQKGKEKIEPEKSEISNFEKDENSKFLQPKLLANSNIKSVDDDKPLKMTISETKSALKSPIIPPKPKALIEKIFQNASNKMPQTQQVGAKKRAANIRGRKITATVKTARTQK